MSAVMRCAMILAFGLLVSCGGAPPRSTGGDERLRESLHCTERPPGGEEDCVGRGCRWGPPLVCRGTQAPPEVLEAERQSYERGEETCGCICPAEEEACSMVP